MPNCDPKLKLVEADGQFMLYLNLGADLKQAQTVLVTTALLGKAKIPQVGYENADGSVLVVNRDYFGKERNTQRPTPGPFENLDRGEKPLRVW